MFQDPGISNVQPPGSYPPYDRGNTADAWLKRPDCSTPVQGEVNQNYKLTFGVYTRGTMIKDIQDLSCKY